MKLLVHGRAIAFASCNARLPKVAQVPNVTGQQTQDNKDWSRSKLKAKAKQPKPRTKAKIKEKQKQK
jgi:hypothetical protein